MISQASFILPFGIASMNKIVGKGVPRGRGGVGGKLKSQFDVEKGALMDTLALYLYELSAAHPLPRPIRCEPEPGQPDGKFRGLLVDALFTFPTRSGQESENYRVLLSKALGDVLRCDARITAGGARFRCGYLLDDKDTDWRLQTSVNPQRGPASVRVRLAWFDRPIPEPVAWVLLGLERGEITREELAEHGLTAPHATHTMLA